MGNFITKNAKLERYFTSNKRVNQVLSQQSLWALSVDLAHTDPLQNILRMILIQNILHMIITPREFTFIFKDAKSCTTFGYVSVVVLYCCNVSVNLNVYYLGLCIV